MIEALALPVWLPGPTEATCLRCEALSHRTNCHPHCMSLNHVLPSEGTCARGALLRSSQSQSARVRASGTHTCAGRASEPFETIPSHRGRRRPLVPAAGGKIREFAPRLVTDPHVFAIFLSAKTSRKKHGALRTRRGCIWITAMSTQITIRLDPPLREAIERKARAEERSIAGQIRHVLQTALRAETHEKAA
jgi:hypothetical protein